LVHGYLSFIFPALATVQWAFAGFLFISGLTIGLVEVAMNTEADRIERHYGKKIMSRCHGFWSLGSMAGAILGGIVAQLGEGGSIIRLPSKAIVLLCILPIGIMLVEGAFIDWSAVFMRSILDASPLLISYRAGLGACCSGRDSTVLTGTKHNRGFCGCCTQRYGSRYCLPVSCHGSGWQAGQILGR